MVLVLALAGGAVWWRVAVSAVPLVQVETKVTGPVSRLRAVNGKVATILVRKLTLTVGALTLESNDERAVARRNLSRETPARVNDKLTGRLLAVAA